MADRLKEIPKQILEWWNRFTSKQKTIIICVVAGVILAFVILFTALTRPQYQILVTCESTKEASEIKGLLDGAELTYKLSEDGLVIQVLKEDISTANLLLGANNIPTASYDLESVMAGGFSTTESDKEKRYKLYLESQLEEDISHTNFVKSANVQLSIPEDDGTLIATEEESFASVLLELDGEMPDGAADTIAKAVATALGNDTCNNITIIDTDGNLLFSGEDENSIAGNASNQLSAKSQAESLVIKEVKKVLLGTNEFDKVEVASNLTLDFSATDSTLHKYTPDGDKDQGVLSHEDVLQSESTSGSGGTPGTDSNTETTYVYQNSDTSNSSSTESSKDYLPNEEITSTTTPAGKIVYDQSSLSVAAISLKVVKEEDAKAQGLLSGVTWDEYKAANGARTKIKVDPDFLSMVAKATGLSESNIVILAYEEPMFIDKTGLNVKATDVIQIVLIIVILGLLAFVVLRSMRTEKTANQEEELSVENLLQSAPKMELEDIEFESKSQARQMIEKFVDENPEAVANLLRNWLGEDWG